MRYIPDPSDETDDQKKRRERIAFVIGIAIVVLFSLLIGISQLMPLIGRPPLELSIVSPIFWVMGVVGAVLSRRHRPTLAVILMLAGAFFSLGYLISRNSGIGITLSIALTLMAAVMIKQTWPWNWIPTGMIAATIAGILLISLDTFWFASRPAPPKFLQLFALVLSATILLMMVVQLFRRFNDFGLQTKMIISFLTITLIPVMLLSMLNNQTALDTLTEDANLRLSSAASRTARSLDDHFDHRLNEIRSEAGIIARSGFFETLPALRPGSEILQDTDKLLKAFRDRDPLNILSYALLDTSGKVVLQHPSIAEVLIESDRDFFTVPMETGRPFVSTIEFEPDNVNGYLYYSAPILDDNKNILGILRARYKGSVVQEQVVWSTGLVGSQSFAVVFDANYLHLAHGTALDTIYKLVAPVSQERYEEMLATHQMPAFPYEESSTNLPELAVMLDDIDNNPYFEARDAPTEDRVNQVAMVRMNTQPWLVGFLQPRDVFLAPVRAQTQRAVLLTGLISAVVVAAAVVLARLLTGPITRLEMVASQVAEGDLMVQAEVESKDEIGRLAVSFNRMTSRLAELIGGLEQRVFERTRALQTSTEVARRLSTILDRNQLLLAVVEQVQDAFDYYHVHIYTVDEKSGKLVLAGGTGEAGRTMLAQNHQINIGQGLVGRAAETKTIVLVSDVSHESGWLPNSLLPETKAEVAIPIELGDELLGVLDVQHNIAGMLTEADSELLQSVASQVAVALRNANLYAETQQQAARETLINEINQRIRSTTNVDEALQIAVRELGRAVGAPKTAVRLTPAKPTNGHSEQAGFPQGK